MKSLTKTILIIAFFLPLSLFAQKKLVKKANTLFKANRYAEASELYARALEKKRNVHWLSKLAYCYKMNNDMRMAEEIYQEIVKEERVKPITYFHYAESLMSNEKYDKAHDWFLQYATQFPEDSTAILLAANCKKIPSLTPYFTEVKVQPFEYNSKVDDHSPVFYRDKIVFASDRKSGPNIMKEKSGWTGRDFLKIYSSEIDSAGNVKKPSTFSGKLNMLNKNADNPSFTKDEEEVFFTRNCDHSSRTEEFNLQLYTAETSNGKSWKNLKRLEFCRYELNYMHPAISPDGNTLFFVSDKGGGEGGTDIYVSKRKKDETWSRPKNAGPVINTSEHEGFPYVDAKGRLFFCSKGHVSYGGFDIFMAEMNEDGTFKEVINVGKPINSSADDISIAFSKDHKGGLFTSSRSGGDDDIYVFSIGNEGNSETEWLSAYMERMEELEVAQKAEEAKVLSIRNPVTAKELMEQAEKANKKFNEGKELLDKKVPADTMKAKGGGA